MRMLSFSSLSPKAVRGRLGNRRRASSASSETSGYSITHPNHNIMQDLTLRNAVTQIIQRRPSGLSLYGLYPAGSHSSDIGDDVEKYQDELSVLEPRPKVTHCAGLFELIEDQRFGL